MQTASPKRLICSQQLYWDWTMRYWPVSDALLTNLIMLDEPPNRLHIPLPALSRRALFGWFLSKLFTAVLQEVEINCRQIEVGQLKEDLGQERTVVQYHPPLYHTLKYD